MTIYDAKLREESKIVNLLKPYPMKNKTSRNAQNQVPSKVMGEPCRHNLLCSCRRSVSEIIDDVKNKIEECIRKYMSLEETVTYLQEQDNHKIEGQLTKLIWERLQGESPEFFKDYDLKCKIGRQIKIFNDLLGKQASLMLQHGELDITALMNFLREDPEGTRISEKLAHIPSKKSEVSPSSLALPDANGPTVDQLQIPPDDQQNPHPYQWSIPFELACSHLIGAQPVAQEATNIALNEMQIPYGQQNQHPQNQWSTANDLTYNYDGAHPIAPADDSSPAFSTVAPATTAQWPPSNGLAYIGAPTVAQSPPALFDMSTFEDGDYTENNGPNFQLMDPLLAELLTQSEYPQQSFSLEELPTLPYGVKNNYGLQSGGNNYGLQYGGSNNTLQYGGSNNTLQYGGSNNTLQGVIPQHNHQLHQEKGEPLYQIHESNKASNNPNSGDSTLSVAQDQRDIQRKHEGRGLFKRRAI